MLFWQAKLAAALLFLAGLFFAYDYVGDRAVAQYKTEQALVQAEADRKQQAKYNLVAQELEEEKLKRRENARVITKQVQKIVTRDIYRNVCIDNDGMLVINKALSGRDSSELDAKMSTPE